MDLTVPYQKVTTADEAYKTAVELITPEYIAKWKIKADISYNEGAKCLKATGKGFTLELNFTDSEAQVKCDLSLMLRPFKKTVLEKMEEKLKRHI
jgi:hypothetical protein